MHAKIKSENKYILLKFSIIFNSLFFCYLYFRLQKVKHKNYVIREMTFDFKFVGLDRDEGMILDLLS